MPFSAMRDRPGSAPSAPTEILRTEGLGKSFGRFSALTSVDLTITRGDLKAIIGPNGAGKTTLFNVISGELNASRGRILYKGHDVTRVPAYALARRGIGRSFQITNVFRKLSVMENVRIAVQAAHDAHYDFLSPVGRLRRTARRAQEILELIGLTSYAGTEAGVLSHGDQRRLEIGIVVATDPELVLLDEPTSGMSREEAHETIDLIRDIAAGRTVLFVEHNMDVVMNVAQRILVMHRGTLIAEGPPDEIRHNDEVRSAYLGSRDA
jgi:branched-chain amino acid transport system ATP-binding protein